LQFGARPVVLAHALDGAWQWQFEPDSLWTWGTWVAANLTMAAWLYETNDRRVDRVIAVNGANAAMCLVTFLWIAALR
jgi:hypothetical protein